MIEIKFEDTLAKAKANVDEVYADMKGYSGSDDWITFYAASYMMESFLTTKDVEEKWESVGVDRAWKPIVGEGKAAH